MTAMERHALRQILQYPDIVETSEGVVLLALIDRHTQRFLEQFEADSEDMEQNGDLEPNGDEEDARVNDAPAPDYSDDPEVPQTQIVYPGH
jgi:hypothetical protein